MLIQCSMTSLGGAPAAARLASNRKIREHFPALRRTHREYPVAYFDGPGGTQVSRAVVEAMNDYLFSHNANTHWPYPTRAETDAISSFEYFSAAPRSSDSNTAGSYEMFASRSATSEPWMTCPH